MSNKAKSKNEKGNLTSSIILGILIGGGVGAAIGLLVNMLDSIIALMLLGASIGAAVGILMGLSNRDKTAEAKSYDHNKQPLRKAFRNISDKARLQLREEQLEISKELVQTAEVTSHKEAITEEKTITVPVTREELVIEKRSFDNDASNTDGKSSEIMRIPLTEEQIEVVKNPVKLEEVSIYKNQYDEIEHIEETLKKEISHIETTGNVKVVDKDNK
ncbi:MAG: hypothetical protein K0S75_468 [Clostridia bacterium]|jgi:uncharacterized protein (TIGR02271 family)|nr:hypothetical protein [Clostridia bacterium]